MCLYFKYYWVPTLTFWHAIFSSTLALQLIYSPHAHVETNSQCNRTLKAYSSCTSILWVNHIINAAFWTLLCISLWCSFDMTFFFLIHQFSFCDVIDTTIQKVCKSLLRNGILLSLSNIVYICYIEDCWEIFFET